MKRRRKNPTDSPDYGFMIALLGGAAIAYAFFGPRPSPVVVSSQPFQPHVGSNPNILY